MAKSNPVIPEKGIKACGFFNDFTERKRITCQITMIFLKIS